MRLIRLASLPTIVILACLASGHPAAQAPSVVELLNRYAAGKFEEVVSDLAAVPDFDALLKDLKRDGPGWISAGGPADRSRREIAAATFALEAARADEWWEWKWRVRQPPMKVNAPAGAEPNHSTPYLPFDVLTWKPAPLLIEWGCALLRQEETPRPIERWWQLGALAVAQRGEDNQFLIGDPKIGLGVGTGEIGNLKTEFKHLDHVLDRFPHEMRFTLAQGIAREWEHDRQYLADARAAFESLRDDVDIGGEASMRLGAMDLRDGRPADAVKQFERATEITRDRYVVYLARYFAGQAWERQRRAEPSLEAYRGAAATIPGAEAASIALAAALFLDGHRAEAQQMAGGMLTADPPPADPWREYAHADDRFWPQIIGHLRAEIQR